MQFTGAIIIEQGVTFAVVLVKRHVTQSDSETRRMVESLRTIRDFQNLPIVLASQDSRGRFEYVGRSDLARFLANIAAQRIPWKKYQTTETHSAQSYPASLPIEDDEPELKETPPSPEKEASSEQLHESRPMLAMNCYKLTPVDPTHVGWERSTHEGVVKVRTTSGRRARALAAIQFGINVQTATSVTTPAPWDDPKAVECEELFGEPDGPEGVYFPIGER